MAELRTKLKIESWDEKPYRELPDGTKYARSEVVLTGTDAAVSAATTEGLLFYRPDGTSTFGMLMRVEATLDGRAGALVLQGSGTYDGTTARVAFEIVAGTGDLMGVSGTAESASTQADYPYMPLTVTYTTG